jgi:hypothetical protein
LVPLEEGWQGEALLLEAVPHVPWAVACLFLALALALAVVFWVWEVEGQVQGQVLEAPEVGLPQEPGVGYPLSLAWVEL